MEFDRLNRWLTLVANFGVVAGIVFLAIEVRQNQSILEQNQKISILEARAAYNQEIQVFRQILAQDEEVARIWMDGVAGNELTPIEDRRFESLCTYQVWADATMYEKAIVFGQAEQARAAAAYNSEMHQRSSRLKQCWDENKNELADFGYGDFVDEVDAGQ